MPLNLRCDRAPTSPAALDRRSFLATAGSVGTVALGLASGCSSAPGPATGSSTKTIRFINYLNWIGKNEYKGFKAATGVAVKEVVAPPSVAREVKIIQDPGAYDMALLDLHEGGRVHAAGDLAKVDLHRVRNYRYVDPAFKVSLCSPQEAFIMPTDFGRIGILYRTDKVTEQITSWADVWRLAPKYSGKITFFDYEPACLAIALLSLGYNANSHNPTQITRAADALIKIKPHLLALLETNEANDVVSGSAVIGMVEDFAGSAAITSHAQLPLKWVDPVDGTSGYLEGWGLIKGSPAARQVEEFMNFHLQPKITANFVNTENIASIEPAAAPYVLASIKKNPIAYPPPSVYRRVAFQQFLGSAQAVWDEQWARFKSA